MALTEVAHVKTRKCHGACKLLFWRTLFEAVSSRILSSEKPLRDSILNIKAPRGREQSNIFFKEATLCPVSPLLEP
jgi:hypothetical protein